MPVLPSVTLALETLAEHHGLTLTAFCLACDRSHVLHQDALAVRFCWNMRVQDIRRRIRRSRCGQRSGRLLVGHHAPADSRSAGG